MLIQHVTGPFRSVSLCQIHAQIWMCLEVNHFIWRFAVALRIFFVCSSLIFLYLSLFLATTSLSQLDKNNNNKIEHKSFLSIYFFCLNILRVCTRAERIERWINAKEKHLCKENKRGENKRRLNLLFGGEVFIQSIAFRNVRKSHNHRQNSHEPRRCFEYDTKR